MNTSLLHHTRFGSYFALGRFGGRRLHGILHLELDQTVLAWMLNELGAAAPVVLGFVLWAV